MSRVQLALNVTDLNAAVDFYSKLFGAEPAKRRPGYANFAIGEPPLKLVLIENAAGRGAGVAGALNHLGVEVESAEEVQAATGRLSAEGLEPDVQESTTCCYAVQDKAWVTTPTGLPGRSTRSWPTLRTRPGSDARPRAAPSPRSKPSPSALDPPRRPLAPAAELRRPDSSRSGLA